MRRRSWSFFWMVAFSDFPSLRHTPFLPEKFSLMFRRHPWSTLTKLLFFIAGGGRDTSVDRMVPCLSITYRPPLYEKSLRNGSFFVLRCIFPQGVLVMIVSKFPPPHTQASSYRPPCFQFLARSILQFPFTGHNLYSPILFTP